MIFKKYSIIILLLTAYIFPTKPPQLTPSDTKKKVEEILASHVSHKTFTSDLAKRALINFIDELDPFKTYFLKSEVLPWIEPDKDAIHDIVTDYNVGKFTCFKQIHDTYLIAIKRRSDLEAKVSSSTLPPPVDADTLKDLDFAADADELYNRLLQIRSLQNDSAQKLDQDLQNRFEKVVKKRRVSREKELAGGNEEEREQRMLGCALKAISSSLDAHTVYFTPQEASQFLIQVQQRLFGIGAQLRDDLNGLSVVRIIEGAPCTGLVKLNDRIIAVDEEPIIGLDITDSVELIRGPKGSPVKLTIMRGEEKLVIEVVRDEIVLKEARYDSHLEPFGDGVIAHLALYSFYQDPSSSSAADLRAEIEKIRAEHTLKGVILDLRNNMGGLMTQAVSVSGLFIKKGIVVSTKDCHDRVVHLRNFEANPAWDGPLIILVNKATISASEIVAQTLQEYGRAFIVGDESTFGKGSYQTFTLESAHQNLVNPEGEYKVTRGLYYTVSGNSPQLHGAKADIVVPGIYSESEIGESEAKFALEPGSIEPNFEDRLDDIHPLHRFKMKRVYLNNLQEKEDLYTPYLSMLRSNSTNRINNNVNYQNFLKALKNETDEDDDTCGQTDLQLEETVNVMKDLLFMQRSAA